MSPGQRSAEERERARLEREARRAQREGRPPPVAAPPTEVPPPDLAGGVTGGDGAATRSASPRSAPPPPERVFEPVKPLPAHSRRVAEPPPPEPARAEPEPEPERVAAPPPKPPVAEPEAPREPERSPVAEPEAPREPEWSPVAEPVERGPEPPLPAEDEPTARTEAPAAPEPFDEPTDETPVAVPLEPAEREPPRADPGWDEPLPLPPRRPLPPFPRTGGDVAPRGGGLRDVAPGGGGALEGGARGGGPDGGAPAAAGAPRPRRRRAPIVVGLLALALLGVAGWFLASLFQPFAGEGEGSVAITIPQGADVASIADLLEREGVIDDAFFFRARATVSGRSDEFKAGDFELRRDMSYAAVMDALGTSPDADTIAVTIPEGRARREVKESIAGTLEGDYVAASRRSPVLDPSRYRAGNPESLEGFLFPATYELDRGATARDLVREQLETFKTEFEKVDLSFARRKNLTPYDVLIIASMVDREAQIARERPLIASVIYNRLSEGIPLGIDATIRFATNNWTEPLTVSELAIDSPYNTRTTQGLPPGPIGSPGLEAIRAAANPRRTDFLYFVVKPNSCGEHAFSETDQQFQRDQARYNSEREARGGRSPTNC